jgi:septal ring factor EnvC (AmiA/AmiB activator)
LDNKALIKTLFTVGLILAIASISVISIGISRQLVVDSQNLKDNAIESEVDTKAKITDNQISQLQNYLSGNVSQVSNLTTQINSLNEEIQRLELTISEKNNQNEKLNEQVKDLTNALNQIDAELENIERTEQIKLLIERLQNQPQEPTYIP